MFLSVIIPVFNEHNTIESIYKKVSSLNIKKELIIVDDGSTDGTRKILRKIELSSNQSVKIIYHSYNKGKGAAIKSALPFVNGDMIIIQDADREYDPSDYFKMIKPILRGECEIVYGVRLSGNRRKNYFRFYFGGIFLSWLTNIIYHTNLSDVTTCYKLFKTNTIKGLNLECLDFSFCAEITSKFLKNGYRIREVPISYTPRRMDEGKKIRWIDGLIFIFALFRYKIFYD